MSSLEDIRKVRLEKINKLDKIGIDSYVNPDEVKQDVSLKEAEEHFLELEKGEKEYHIVGRIMIKRGAGNISFAKIFDGTNDFQVVLKTDILGKEKMKIFEKLFDMGDFAEFLGTFFVTERGQKSLLVKSFRMLTKALLPLPEKYHGLENIEEKYRKRYLDVLSDRSTYQRFIVRSKIIKEIRRILDEEGFLEVETPILQKQASGAMAKTFNTHHNDYDMDMVLRIAYEIEHKMIMAGGYPAIYEISKIFRNEGSDSTHMQEFTMIEWYRAYRGLDYNLKLTEKIFKSIAKNVIGKTIFEIPDADGNIIEVDFGQEWPKVEFNDLIKEYAKIDPSVATREELEEKAVEFGEDKYEVKKLLLGNLLDVIYKRSARKNIKNPTYVLHYPSSVKPLAIQNNNGTAEVAQLVIAGAEITNQYAELVNPVIQRQLLEEQSKAKKSGDEEAMGMDEGFLEAMEHGMPPMTGIGYGIDRLVAIFTEQSNLRDTVFFPIVKPISE